MGGGIAHAGALGGFDVRLHDVEEGTLKNATSSIEKEMKKAGEKGRLEEGEMHEALGRISTTSDLKEAVSGTDLVIETVLEKMDLKLVSSGSSRGYAGSYTVRTNNASKVRFSVTVGQEPEIEVALI